MQRPGRELIDRLAAEYVLGTLRGRARARFTRWLDSEEAALREDVRRAVARWEERLVHLADGVAPVDPSPRVWQAIEQRTRTESAARDVPGQAPSGSPRAPAPTRSWRPLALAASLLLAAVAAWLWIGREPAVEWQAAAELRDAARPETLWFIEVDPTRSRLRVRAAAPYSLVGPSVHELWALAGNAAPVSLGLLPQSGAVERALTEAQRAALSSATQLAVSREPAGGSPTGLPTGPVLLVVPAPPLA